MVSNKNKSIIKRVFFIGLIVLLFLTLLGHVFTTKLVFSKEDSKPLSNAERNIAKLSTVMIWVLFAWVIAGFSLGIASDSFKKVELQEL